MNIASIDIKDMLLGESALGLEFAKNLFIGLEPSKPSDTVTIFDYSVIPPEVTLDGAGTDTPSVQIRVRSSNLEQASSLAEGIRKLLHGRANETWNSTYYCLIYCTSGPQLLDWDENGRCRYVVSFNIQRRESNEQQSI